MMPVAEVTRVRGALLDLARERGIEVVPGREEQALETLLDLEVTVPEPTDGECERYFRAHRDRFVAGASVHARHILFALTPGAALDPLRHQAERTLVKLLAGEMAFEAAAAIYSNCPTSVAGGRLGELRRGDAMPEFEEALFSSETVGLLPHLVRTRMGFHIVEVEARTRGVPLALDAVVETVRERLRERAGVNALLQYVGKLAVMDDIPPAGAGAEPDPNS